MVVDTSSAGSHERALDTDIAIVGYGPSGVSAATVLGASGVRAIAVERYRDIYPRARAVTVNDWTLRCFQSVGLDQELLRDMDPMSEMRWLSYAGKQLFRSRLPASILGQPVSSMIYQPAMEQTLRRGVERYSEYIEVRFGEEACDIAQDADGVTVTTRHAETGALSTIRAKYLLACDGGSSSIRTLLNVGLVGSTIDTLWVVIDAKVKRWWPERHLLTFWSDAKRPVVDIPLALGNHRWEFPLDPGESENDFKTSEQLWRLLGTMGVTTEHVEIHQYAFYRHHVRHAERWRVGRVFLLGDAAHMMPPWAGQGMQSGIRDAFNIGWKLREVLAGRLPDSILDTYETERAPNVEAVTQLSERLGRIIKRQMSGREKVEALMEGIFGKLGIAPRNAVRGQRPFVGPGWLRGEPGDRNAIGQMVPQPMVATANGHRARLDDLIGNGFALLGDELDPSSFLNESERAGWDALGARYFAVRSGSSVPQSDGDIIDLDGTLLKWMRNRKTSAVALRPDRFVAAAQGTGLGVP